MIDPRQAEGRVRQKQRTRAALLQSAAELLRAGTTPTVVEVAEAAGISRATAYRYFPTQELMLVEAVLDSAVPDVSAMLADEGDANGAEARLDRLVHGVHIWVADNELALRNLLRLSMDPVDHSKSAGTKVPKRRAGRRTAWIATALSPVSAQLPDVQFDRLVAAISLYLGIETQVVLMDVCGLNREQSDNVARWAAGALLRETLREASGQ